VNSFGRVNLGGSIKTYSGSGETDGDEDELFDELLELEGSRDGEEEKDELLDGDDEYDGSSEGDEDGE
jgi:hypothetical protein